MSACQCSTCSHSSSSRDEEFYMYREKKGKSVFTGIIRKGDEIYWVGKDERSMRTSILRILKILISSWQK